MGPVSLRLQQLRTRAGLTPRELDQLAGLNRGHVLKLEDGRRPTPTVATLQRLASVFGISVGYLATGEGEEPSQEALIEAAYKARKRLASRRAAS